MDTPRNPDPFPFPPDLGRLRIIETWCAVLLDAVRRQIADLERQEQVPQAAAVGSLLASAVEWQIQYGIGAKHSVMLVHTGDCRLVSGRTRPATREQARDALRHPQVEACGICAADRELGLTEP
ncbi:DUF6233 domain-containing protein [Streptomyces sp. NPDC002073]